MPKGVLVVPSRPCVPTRGTEHVVGTLQELLTRFGDGRQAISDALELFSVCRRAFYEVIE